MSATSAYRKSNMTLQKWAAAVSGVAVLILSLTPPANARTRETCRSLNKQVHGQWYFLRRSGDTVPVPGPTVIQSGNTFSIQGISGTGRVSGTRIQFTYTHPRETITGTLSPGRISWRDNTVWVARNFSGSWKYFLEPRRGPIVTQTGDRLGIDMSAYERPPATGTATRDSAPISVTPSVATATFPDDGIFDGTLVSPSCIEWTNTTIWTK